MVEFRKNAARDKLYALAVENGVSVAEDADRDAIIDALTAHNEKEAAEKAAEEATEGAGSAADGEGTTDTTHGETPTERPTEGEENSDGSGTGGETPTEGATEGAGSAADGGGTADTTPGETPAERLQKAAEGYDTFVYCGPSIPRGRLKENAVFRGTLSDVLEYLADVVDDYPQIPRLIVPTNRLAAFSVKVKTPGNIAHKYYSDIASAIRRGKEV